MTGRGGADGRDAAAIVDGFVPTAAPHGPAVDADRAPDRRPLRARVDLAVATPVFADLTFVGLEGLPSLGDERFAGDLVTSPGGGAITAVAAARLGLGVAVASPVGEDAAGRAVAGALSAEGVGLRASRSGRTPVTMVMPYAGERAMVTFDPGVRAARGDIEALSPRAVAVSLGELHLIPDEAAGFVSCGDDDSRTFAGRPPHGLRRLDTLLTNLREAQRLTGLDDAEAAAHRLAERAPAVVVTLGPDGAIAVTDGALVRAPGVDVGPPVDTTGAGDCFAAAWIWGSLRGVPLVDRLRWAVLYGALSVRVVTGAAGAATSAELALEGQRRGLPPLPALP